MPVTAVSGNPQFLIFRNIGLPLPASWQERLFIKLMNALRDAGYLRYDCLVEDMGERYFDGCRLTAQAHGVMKCEVAIEQIATLPKPLARLLRVTLSGPQSDLMRVMDCVYRVAENRGLRLLNLRIEL